MGCSRLVNICVRCPLTIEVRTSGRKMIFCLLNDWLLVVVWWNLILERANKFMPGKLAYTAANILSQVLYLHKYIILLHYSTIVSHPKNSVALLAISMGDGGGGGGGEGHGSSPSIFTQGPKIND